MGINLMEIYSATEQAIKPRDTGTVSPAVVNLCSHRHRQMGAAREGISRLMAACCLTPGPTPSRCIFS